LAHRSYSLITGNKRAILLPRKPWRRVFVRAAETDPNCRYQLRLHRLGAEGTSSTRPAPLSYPPPSQWGARKLHSMRELCPLTVNERSRRQHLQPADGGYLRASCERPASESISMDGGNRRGRIGCCLGPRCNHASRNARWKQSSQPLPRRLGWAEPSLFVSRLLVAKMRAFQTRADGGFMSTRLG
jgi:hypothetical protein